MTSSQNLRSRLAPESYRRRDREFRRSSGSAGAIIRHPGGKSQRGREEGVLAATAGIATRDVEAATPSGPVLPLSSISKLRYKETVSWRVEILSETVAAEIAALPADMQARFLRLAERITSTGLESLGEPHVKHLEGKLWELRLTGRDGIARALYVTAIGRRVIVVRAFVKKTQKTPRAEIELALRRAKEIT